MDVIPGPGGSGGANTPDMRSDLGPGEVAELHDIWLIVMPRRSDPPYEVQINIMVAGMDDVGLDATHDQRVIATNQLKRLMDVRDELNRVLIPGCVARVVNRLTETEVLL